MAIKIFRGTSNSDWYTAGNWTGGTVPAAGDDVIFDALSPNCTLSANAPATGRLNSLICTNYSNTLDLNDYTIRVGQGAFAGTILDVGVHSVWEPGTIELYTTTTSNSNTNVVQGRDNINFSDVNIRLAANANGRYIDIQSNIRIKDLIFTTYFVYLANRGINIYVYRNIDDTSGYNDGNTSINLFNNSLYIMGGGTINCYNSIVTQGSVYIQRDVELLRNFTLYLQSYNNSNPSKIQAGNFIKCNGYDLIVNIAGGAYNHDIDITDIDNLVINSVAQYPTHTRIINNPNINRKLIITETIRTRSPYNVVRSATPGTKVNVTLGNDCKYMLLYAKLQDIHFNKPIKSFYCSTSNCDNITSGDYPEIYVNVD